MLLRRKKDGTTEKVAALGSAVQRERIIEAQLPSGEYLIVPTTSGARPKLRAAVAGHRAAAARLLFSGDASSSSVSLLPPAVRQAFHQACYALDVDLDGMLGSRDLSSPAAAPFVSAAGIVLRGGGDGPIKLAQYRDGLSPDALLAAIHASWANLALVERRRRWRQLFISLGYDEQLRFSWHPYVLSVHASRTVTLRSFPARANQSEAVQVEQVISQGTAQRVGAHITVHVQRTNGGVSFAATNTAPHPCDVKLDLSASRNVRANLGTLTPTIGVAAGAKAMLLVLMPIDRCKPWEYKYRAMAFARGGYGPQSNLGPSPRLAQNGRAPKSSLGGAGHYSSRPPMQMPADDEGRAESRGRARGLSVGVEDYPSRACECPLM